VSALATALAAVLDALGGAARRLRGMPPRDPRQYRHCSPAALRWVLSHRAWRGFYLIRYLRLARLRLLHPQITTEGMVFLGPGVELFARKGFGRLVLGAFTHLGRGNALRAHEGTLRVGRGCVFGKDNTVNCYLDIELGPATLLADWVYICDFDHVFSDITVPIKDQGITKRPVRLAGDTWLGTKVTVLSGVTVGWGCVIAANAVVNVDVPAYAVGVGVPVRVVRDRRVDHAAEQERQRALADIARKTAVAAAQARTLPAPGVRAPGPPTASRSR